MNAVDFIAILAITYTLTMFAATMRQTRRADRAEAALARVEAVIAEVEREVVS